MTTTIPPDASVTDAQGTGTQAATDRRIRPDWGLIGIVAGFAAFLFIFFTNTLPAQRELANRERVAEEYEQAVAELKQELERELRYQEAVRTDPDVILSLWLRRNPAAEESDPAAVLGKIPGWSKDVLERPAPPSETATPPTAEVSERGRPELRLPERPSPSRRPSPPSSPTRRTASDPTSFDPPDFLLRR